MRAYGSPAISLSQAANEGFLLAKD